MTGGLLLAPVPSRDWSPNAASYPIFEAKGQCLSMRLNRKVLEDPIKLSNQHFSSLALSVSVIDASKFPLDKARALFLLLSR